MTTDEVAEILLVRAVEEAGIASFAAVDDVDALAAAGEFDDERAWFARRASWLLANDLARFRRLLGLCEALRPRLGLSLGLPLLLGLSSNYLGPYAQIHVLYNSIALLVAWNLAVYSGLLTLPLWRIWRAKRLDASSPATASQAGSEAPASAATPASFATPAAAPRRAVPRARPGGGWLGRVVRRSVSRLWLRAQRASVDSKESAREFADVGLRFFELWDRAARPYFAMRTRRDLHAAAAAFAVGAVAGMFVRGLFFEYAVVWKSTFLRDPDTVALLLKLTLGPASALLGWGVPNATVASSLMDPRGVDAAPWITLWALTAMGIVVLPRSLLALAASRRAARLGPGLDLGFGDAYYTDALTRARVIAVGHVKAEIEGLVRAECAQFAERVAVRVGAELYDARIAPRLERFRGEGGRIAELEDDLRSECAAFEDTLAQALEQEQRRFEESLARAAFERVGSELALPVASVGRLGAAASQISDRSVGHVGDALSERIEGDIGAAITISLATAVGTVSGGFGTKFGAAILVTLLHTTGPVGFLLGAIGGAATAMGALWAGRERMREGLRQVPLPAAGMKVAMPRGRFDRLVAEGRQRSVSTVQELLHEALDPLTDEIADQVWARVKLLIAEATAPETDATSLNEPEA